MIRSLDLFAGAGGSIWAGKILGWRCRLAVEIDLYCRNVLLARQADGSLEKFKICSDIRGVNFTGTGVDIVTAGFPCQPFSLAGKRRGEDDERNLWPETARVLGEVRPEFAFLENVAALAGNAYFHRVLGDLSELGFDAEWGVYGAADVGAPHRRKRLWILAYRDRRRCQKLAELYRQAEQGGCSFRDYPERRYQPVADPGCISERRLQPECECGLGCAACLGRPCEDVAYAAEPRLSGAARPAQQEWQGPEPGRGAVGVAHCSGLEGHGGPSGAQPQFPSPWPPGPKDDWSSIPEHLWPATPQPRFRRVADGVARRSDRLRALGNGWVPQCAVEAFRQLLERAARP